MRHFPRCYNCHEPYRSKELKGIPPRCANCRSVLENLANLRYEREQYNRKIKGDDLDNRIYSPHPRKSGRSASYRTIPEEVRFIEKAVFRMR